MAKNRTINRYVTEEEARNLKVQDTIAELSEAAAGVDRKTKRGRATLGSLANVVDQLSRKHVVTSPEKGRLANAGGRLVPRIGHNIGIPRRLATGRTGSLGETQGAQQIQQPAGSSGAGSGGAPSRSGTSASQFRSSRGSSNEKFPSVQPGEAGFQTRGGGKQEEGIKLINQIAAGAGVNLGRSNIGKALNTGLPVHAAFVNNRDPNSLARVFLEKGVIMGGARRQRIPIGQGRTLDLFTSRENEELGFALERNQRRLQQKLARRR